VKFTNLRLSGFKSFVDPTELLLEPGLTGVVGPNGCGKSNLLEAMRWVMGESSAKSMRGEGMDDVIFAGAATRPPRNFAEVSLMVDNADKLAPPQFGDAETLEIVRRITRDVGSTYRVNGKESRARDVKMLFADAASGAQSPALVRQGRIGELISAKPTGRRRFLEEAAGVSGLNVRRREAELKLKAAEENLVRVDDVLTRLDAQIGSLKRQARQAERYTKLSDDIKEMAALLVWLRYAEADAEALAAETAMNEATRTVAAATTTASEATRKRDETTEALPPIREEAVVAQAVYQRLIAKRDGLDAEADRAKANLERLEGELGRIVSDLARENDLNADAVRALEELTTERATLEASVSNSGLIEQAAQAALAAASIVTDAEGSLDKLAARAAAATAERSAAERAKTESERSLDQAEGRLETELPKIERLARETAEAETTLEQARIAKAEAAQAAEDAPDRITQKHEARKAAEESETDARAALSTKRSTHNALKSELESLEKALAAESSSDMGAAIVTRMRAAPGYEAALAAALGEEAAAPELQGFSEKARGWLALKLLGSSPSVGEPLSTYVDAPAALARRLAVTSVISREEGPEAQKDLRPGQHLVSPEGDLWRWDGYFSGAETRASDPAVARLARLNRVDAVKAELVEGEAKLAAATQTLDRLEREVADARLSESNARAEHQKIQDAAASTARALADAEATLGRLRAAESQSAEEVERQRRAEARARETLAAATASLAEIGDPTALREEADTARTALIALRQAHQAAKSEHDELVAAERARSGRLEAIAREQANWESRAAQAKTRTGDLDSRQTAITAERDAAKSAPGAIAAQRDALVTDLDTAEKRVTQANDTLSTAESEARTAARDASEAESALSTAREARARADAVAEGAVTRKEEAAAALREEAQAEPEAVAERFADDDAPVVPLHDAEERLSKLKMDRERLGAVNLRAAIEIEEAGTEREALGTERDDLEEAIAKLRKGLAELNKEGRARLLEAFEKVNGHFTGLFTHLFGGGNARLELTESDDPLQAGLEIMCEPPGKRLQSLSLMSGGEQTLTALALIFAVFLVNPAPVCVLDEVDAPLDDANVTRFCDLLDEMTRRADARFLVITHHAVTMARMNRLFGVTMVERGVSRLVSVDLGAAVDLVASEAA
ncbi:UNVERIFIED_CONTAM: hypothetical protein GTU68_015284, partial [Idotea baltica]|nr:hypothetical protein [Idotea baltica]